MTSAWSVEFADTVDTHAFSGIFNIITNGTLKLSTDSITNVSFGIKLSSNGKLNATGSVALKLAYLEFDGVALPAGTSEGVEWTGSGVIDTDFISVTNRILMNGKVNNLSGWS